MVAGLLRVIHLVVWLSARRDRVTIQVLGPVPSGRGGRCAGARVVPLWPWILVLTKLIGYGAWRLVVARSAGTTPHLRSRTAVVGMPLVRRLLPTPPSAATGG
jgi:hypothetical protein